MPAPGEKGDRTKKVRACALSGKRVKHLQSRRASENGIIRRFSLPVSRCSVSLDPSFRFAHEFRLLGFPIPPRAGVVINTSSRINPNKPALGRLNNKRSDRSWNFLRTESGNTKEEGDEKYPEKSHRL